MGDAGSCLPPEEQLRASYHIFRWLHTPKTEDTFLGESRRKQDDRTGGGWPAHR